MVIKVAVPHQFKLKVIPDLKTLFFVDRKDIHYIGGSDILPAPLEAAAEKKAIKDLGTEKDENARKILPFSFYYFSANTLISHFQYIWMHRLQV